MKALVVGLGVGVVAAGVAAGMLWRDLGDVRAQNAQLREQVISLQSAQVTASMAPVAAPPAGVPTAANTQVANADQPAAAPAATAAAAQDKSANALMEGLGKMLSTPEGRDMMVAQVRMILPQQYPDLAKELGLSKVEEEKFFDLLARQQADLSGNALGALGGAGQDRAAIQEIQRKAREQQQAQQTELNAMLGSKVPQWQEYQRTLPFRRQVNQLQATLGDENALSASQSKALMTALDAERTRIQEDSRNAPRPPAGTGQNNMEQQMQRELEANARLVNAASAHLNPQQLDSYKKMLQQQTETGRRLMQAVMPQGQ